MDALSCAVSMPLDKTGTVAFLLIFALSPLE